MQKTISSPIFLWLTATAAKIVASAFSHLRGPAHNRPNVDKLLSRSRQDERCDANSAEQEAVQSGLFPEAEFQSHLLLIKETINTSNMCWL